MPPKRQFDRKRIVQAAFEIARGQGLANLTARGVAENLGCSTTPIYSAFKTMGELEDQVCEASTEVMLQFQTKPYTGSPLLDLCLGYVLFAKEEPQLFRDMFMNKSQLSEHSREMKTYAFDRLMDTMVSKEPMLAKIDEAKRLELLEMIWTYTHGLAAQINIGARDLPDRESIVTHLRRVLDPLVSSITR